MRRAASSGIFKNGFLSLYPFWKPTGFFLTYVLFELPEVNFTVQACLRAIAGLVPDRGNEASCNRLAGGGFGLKSVF